MSGAGAAFVFVKPAGGWKDAHETAALTASDGAANEGLGGGVAISGDTITATAAGHKVATRDQQGADYVFVKPASGWANAKQTAELSASDGGSGDQFGFVVSISGGTVVVGSPFHRAAGVQAGAAYVYLQTFAGWNGQRSEAAELTPSDGSTNDRFGVAVGVSGDTAVVGSLLHQVGTNEAEGGAYLFAKPGNVGKSITETQQLVPADGAAHDVLGDAVAMSGNVAFAAAPLKTVGANAGQGVVYAFGPPPAITISTPADGASFTQGQVVVPSFALDSDGLKATRSVTYTVAPAVVPQTKLAITGLKQSAKKWHLRARGGTTFSFRLNKPARVTLRFSRRGRAHGSGTLGRAGHAGLNRIRFHGRLARKKRLTPGRYALQVTATNTAGERSVTRKLSFRIVR